MSSVTRSRILTALAAAVVAAPVLAGCAHYDPADSAPFHPAPSFGAGAEVAPQTPGPTAEPPLSGTPATPPNGPCVDPDPNVVATCLGSTGPVVVLPDGSGAFVGERLTGRILRVAPGQSPSEVARIPVDPAGDGGLTGLALSPTFAEDQLIYAYVTTGSDNRVVRVAPGDVPKEILTGIPRGATGNAGAIGFAHGPGLLVLTGDAGDPALGTAPSSLAGKLLRVTALSPGAQSKSAPQRLQSGFGLAGGLCTDTTTGNVWVTDRIPTQDRLQRVSADGAAVTPVWTWPDRPGVGGCAATSGLVAVATSGAQAVSVIAIDKDTGAVSGTPQLVAKGKYGALGSADLGPDGTIWAGTVNKTAGKPAPTDDRVVRIPMPNPSGGRD